MVGSGLEFMLGKGGPMELVMRRYNYFEVWGRGVLEGLEALTTLLGVLRARSARVFTRAI